MQQDYVIYTRPDGSQFSVNATESPDVIAMLLGDAHNAGVTSQNVQQTTLDYGDYDTFASIYGATLANQGLAQGSIKPSPPPVVPIAGAPLPAAPNAPGTPGAAPHNNNPAGPTTPTTPTTAAKQSPLVIAGAIALGLWLLQ